MPESQRRVDCSLVFPKENTHNKSQRHWVAGQGSRADVPSSVPAPHTRFGRGDFRMGGRLRRSRGSERFSEGLSEQLSDPFLAPGYAANPACPHPSPYSHAHLPRGTLFYNNTLWASVVLLLQQTAAAPGGHPHTQVQGQVWGLTNPHLARQ